MKMRADDSLLELLHKGVFVAKKMTQKAFWEALKKRRNGWKLVDGVKIRHIVDRQRVCPVSDIANTVLGEHVYNCSITSPARDIGLNERFARDVADASDGHIEGKLGEIRKKLLESLALKEKMQH